jgi:hypothetical protein
MGITLIKMATIRSERTTVPCRKKTLQRLKKMASKAETYDEYLNKLMDEKEESK